MEQGYSSSYHMDMDVAGLTHHLHKSGHPQHARQTWGNNLPRGHRKTKRGEQTPPSIYTGCIWTPLASILAVGACRHPQHSVPLTDRTMS